MSKCCRPDQEIEVSHRFPLGTKASTFIAEDPAGLFVNVDDCHASKKVIQVSFIPFGSLE